MATDVMTLKLPARLPDIRARRTRRKFRLALVALAGLAGTGVYLGVQMIEQGPGLPTPGFGVGQSAPTSFGFVAMEHVEHIGGLSAKDLSSANHGIQNLVNADQEQVQATFQLVSSLDTETAAYSPAMFTMLVGEKAEAYSVSSTTILTGTLQPHAAVEGHLGFIVPLEGERLVLRFTDPANGTALYFDVGRAGTSDGSAPIDNHIHS